MLESLFNKVAGLQVCNFIKKTPRQVSPCEYCEICKNTFFTEYLRWLLLSQSRVAECLVFDFTTVESYKIHRLALNLDDKVVLTRSDYADTGYKGTDLSLD